MPFIIPKRYCNFIVFNLFLSVLSVSAQQSNLATGKWLKYKFAKTGVYKISFDDLKSHGIDPSTINPKNIHFYTVHGPELSADANNINTGNYNGLQETPIQVIGEDDGKFDPADYILLYKQSSSDYRFLNGKYSHFNNFYSSENLGIIGANDQPGLRITPARNSYDDQLPVYNQGYSMLFHDSDMVNPLTMGRTWVGEKMGNESLNRSFEYTLPSDVDSFTFNTNVATSFFGDTGSVVVTVNSMSKRVKGIALNSDDVALDLNPFSFVKTPLPITKKVTINYSINRRNTGSSAFVDYFEIEYLRKLTFSSDQFAIENPELALMKNNFNIEIQNMKSDVEFWDVGNPNTITKLSYVVNNGNTVITYPSKSDFSRIWAFIPQKSWIPQFVETVNASNLLTDLNTDFLIITHPKFVEASQKLANFRKTHDHYTVSVALTSDIYNQYAGGQQDLQALRDYIRHLYNAGNKTLKYVLLMGAASYDMKDRVAGNSNYIPIYHSPSDIKQEVFCLDDYLAYIDSGYGNPLAQNNKMSVSVGRITCRTAEEANGVVNKLINYAQSNTLGAWRNRITFVCDDVDKSYESEFVEETESYAKYIASTHADLRQNKIYSDAFKQNTNGNNEKYPDVNIAINKAMSDGTLFMNYQGHGGEKGWAQEGILDIPMINGWRNSQKMPILFTATCEFSRFDNPQFQSAGELCLLNPYGGAIALMSTTRLVFVSGNTKINDAFWTQYGFPKPNEPIPTVGDLYLRMKNRPQTPYNYEDFKFALLGDPSMKVAFPEHNVVVDSINGIPMQMFHDTLGAFSKVSITGFVQERLKSKMTDFNGELDVEIYDKPIVKYTLNNDGMGYNVPFDQESSILYKGKVNVVKGDFKIVFTVPKDIAYNVGSGRAIFYASNGTIDAGGAWRFLIGGSSKITDIDTVGPIVTSFMNDTTFKNGSNVSVDAAFVGRVFDYSGINSTGAGIGRDMQIIVDPNTDNAKSIVVNDYFSYDNNSYQTGTIRYPFSNLSPGKHTIVCKVWDIYNNSGSSSVEFNVTPGRKLVINESGASPNPSRAEDFTLWVSHNLGGEDLSVRTTIFDRTGQEVFTFDKTELNSTSKFEVITYQNIVSKINAISNGMFYYRIELKTNDGLYQSSSGKFIILQ